MSTPVLVFLVACASSVGASFALNPFPQSRRLDALVVGVIFALFGGASGIAALLWPEGAFGTLLYGLIAVLPGLAVAVLTVVQRRRLRWQVESVLDPRFGTEGLASLRAHLSKKKPLQQAQDARRAAWVLATKGRLEDAATVLADVPIDDVHARWTYERAVHRNDLASYQIRLGDTDAARATLAAIEDAPSSLASVLRSKRALLAALGGAGDEALQSLESITLPAGSPHHVVVRLARAHAQATRDEAEAKQALRELAEIEPDWLARASTPEGPATSLATALAAERDAPYR